MGLHLHVVPGQGQLIIPHCLHRLPAFLLDLALLDLDLLDLDFLDLDLNLLE